MRKTIKASILQQQFKSNLITNKNTNSSTSANVCQIRIYTHCHAITPQIAPHHPIFRRTEQLTHAS